MEVIQNREEWLAARTARTARQYGRTTGIILKAIGFALCQPGEAHYVCDHHDGGRKWAAEVARRTMQMVDALGLKNVSVTLEADRVIVTSRNFGARDPGRG